jgi:hypothetical protein
VDNKSGATPQVERLIEYKGVWQSAPMSIIEVFSLLLFVYLIFDSMMLIGISLPENTRRAKRP